MLCGRPRHPESPLGNRHGFRRKPRGSGGCRGSQPAHLRPHREPGICNRNIVIDPLPHQRVAVYDHILQTWPIRFLLADDAGAGKTIMTGLTVRELLSRRLVRRVLVAAPAGLVGNWQREMRTLFRLQTRIIPSSEAARGNPFLGPSSDFAIVSIDTAASRNALPDCERLAWLGRATTSWSSTKPTSSRPIRIRWT